MHLYVRINKWNWNSYIDQKRKQVIPLPGRRREHGRGRPRQSRDRRAMSGTTGKEHTERWTSSRVGRSRLKTWSKSDFSIAETIWPTYLLVHEVHIYIYDHNIDGTKTDGTHYSNIPWFSSFWECICLIDVVVHAAAH